MGLFVAAMPDARSRAEVAALARRLCPEEARAPLEFNLHVTLRFFGEMASTAVPKLVAGIGQAAKGVGPIELGARRLAPMPARRPTMLWLELGPSDALASLCARLLAGIPSATEADRRNLRRGLRPHFTLARGKQVAKAPWPQAKELLPERVVLERICLLRSPPDPAAGLYPCTYELKLDGS